MKYGGIVASFALLLSALPLSAIAQDIPKDEGAFTEYVAGQLRTQLGDSAVVVAGPLTLKLGRLQANLDRIFTFCHQNAAACSAEVSTFVKGVTETYEAQGAPISAAAIRLVIRPTQYAQQMRASLKAQASAWLPKPFVEGLVILPVLDSPRTLRMLTVADLKTFGLTDEQVQQVALANLRSALTPLMEVAKVEGSGRIGQLVGDTYIPSRLALLDSWAPLAEAQGGKLIVVAPATDALFYVGDDSPAAIDALRAVARNVMGRAPHPLSDILLRWRATGWEVVH